jgi:segregation and condensation protein A
MDFRVALDCYRGPFDLLLYLVRKYEVDAMAVPLAEVAAQYLAHLEVLQELSVDDVGEFLDLASTLLEIKSRLVLPHGGEEADEAEIPHEQLLQSLLEYKQYKDAASRLEERSRDWQQHYARLSDDLPPRRIDPSGQPIKEVELWDLVSALGRIMRESVRTRPATIVYDDTPIHVYMQRIHQELGLRRRAAFSDMFEMRMHKSAMIGVFLAILELVRHHDVVAEQAEIHGEIWLTPGEKFDPTKEIAAADDYSAGRLKAVEELGSKPR